MDETVEETVTDLNRLLLTAGERGPYLFVGASIAGIFVRAYHHNFPEDVAGLVFANTTNRIGLLVPGGGGLLWDLSEDQVRSIYPLPSEDKGPRPSRLGPPFDRLPLELQPVRLWLEQRLWEGSDPTSEGPATYLSWRREFLREFDEKCSGREYPLVDIPLIVLSSNPAPSPTLPSTDQPSCLRDNAADGLDLLSSNSLYVVATGSGHEIHLFQPEVVVRSLDRALVAIRSGIPLSSTLQGLD
jgi:pimeloyl-ACP methyl ester carboxylesterase